MIAVDKRGPEKDFAPSSFSQGFYVSNGHSGAAVSAESARRPIIIHYHFFKNAGTSVDAILQRNFGAGWTSREYPPRSTPNAAGEFLTANPQIAALSSHTLPLPPPDIPDAEILPILFIRHPLDRLKSAYLFERNQRADTEGSRLARQHDLAGYLRARLAVPGDRSCRNFHVQRLAMAEPADNGSEWERALRVFERLPFIGSVEAFDASLAALEAFIKPRFPEFRVFQARENVSRAPSSIEDRVAQLEDELGAETFEIIAAANADDLELYRRALARYTAPSYSPGSGSTSRTRKIANRDEAGAKKAGAARGRESSDADPKAAWEEDKIAALTLRPARGPGLARVFRERDLRFTSGLSLACDNGRAERELLKLGICERFHGVDSSPEAIAEARQNAQGLVHSVLELERLAEQIWRSLKPSGCLWIHDYIGESQFQFDDLRLDIANRILAVLPERYRRDRVHDRILRAIARPKPGALASPFEAVRSADIVPVFSRWFDIEYRHEESAFMGRVCPRGMRANYTETEDGPVIFELLMLIEGLLVEHGILAPHTGQYLMRRKAEPLAGGAPEAEARPLADAEATR
ncbi:MAG: class I SAM-dependent methyltransferase [Alphaproteobacteria bacterium]|nr:MAG: class I SAM-dependent methyltransferase [Alphaproteobacteria bacterium]